MSVGGSGGVAPMGANLGKKRARCLILLRWGASGGFVPMHWRYMSVYVVKVEALGVMMWYWFVVFMWMWCWVGASGLVL